MPRIDPALLLFAGNLLQNSGGGTGFGQSLGGSLTAAGQGLQLREQAERQQKQDLIANAESAIGLRAALGELQARQQAQNDRQAFLQSLPPEQRAAAAVDTGQAARAQIQQTQPLTPAEQQRLDLQREQLGLAREDQEFEQGLALDEFGLAREKLDLAKAEAAQPPRPKLSDIANIRKQYSSESAAFTDMKSAYKKVLNTSPSPAGDLSMVFAYMKILDPGSAVREAEQADARNASGVPAQIRNTYNRMLTGERLDPAQRADFRTEAGILYQGAYESQLARQQGFSDIAGRAGVDARDITDAIAVDAPEKLRGDWIDRRAKSLGASLDDLDETAQKHGLTIEQVLDQLEASRG